MVALSVGLLASSIPFAVVSAAAPVDRAPLFEFEDVDALAGEPAPPAPVPSVESTPIDQTRPVIIDREVHQVAADVVAVQAVSQEGPSGRPNLLGPFGSVVVGQQIYLSAERTDDGVGNIEYTIAYQGEAPPDANLLVGPTCESAPTQRISAPSEVLAGILSTWVERIGYYVWCARNEGAGAAGWEATVIRVASARELGLLGINTNDAVVQNVNVATGNMVLSREDIVIPSIGPELAVRRVYNSSDETVGAFGVGWSFNYDVRLAPIGDGFFNAAGVSSDFVVTQPDGSVIRYSQPVAGGNLWIAGGESSEGSRSETAELSYNANRQRWQLSHRDGGRHEFFLGADGFRLVSIFDAWNNEIRLTYYGSGEERGKLHKATDVSSGADIDSARTLTFTWKDDKVASITAPNPAAPDGPDVTWTYGYGPSADGEADFLSSACDPRTYAVEQSGFVIYEAICERYGAVEVGNGVKIGDIRTPSQDDLDTDVTFIEVDYDTSRRVQSVTHIPSAGESHRTTFVYSVLTLFQSALTQKVADPKGTIWEYEFNREGELISEGRSEAPKTTYEYDTAGRRTRIVDAAENAVDMFYADGHLIATRNGADEVTFFAYDNNDLVAICDNRAAKPAPAEWYEFDTNITIYEGHEQSDFCILMEYERHRMTKRTTTINRTTFPPPANPADEQRPDALNLSVESWEYMSTKPRGKVKSHTVPVAGEGSAARAETTTYTYWWPSGDRKERIDPSGLTTTYFNNAWGQPTSVSSQATTEAVRTKTAGYTYNVIGLVVEAIGASYTNPLVDEPQALRLRTSTSWTAQRRPDVVTEQAITAQDFAVGAARSTVYEYDRLGREIAAVDPAEGRTSRTFDSRGNVEVVCDARRNCIETAHGDDNLPDTTTALEYNGVDDALIETFDHDASGRLVSSQVADRAEVVFVYDGADRLISEGIKNLRRRRPDGEIELRLRRLNEYVYSSDGTGRVVELREGGHLDGGKQAFRTTSYEHTLSGLVSREMIGVVPAGNAFAGSQIAVDYAYASSGRLRSEKRSRGGTESRTVWTYEHGNVVQTDIAKYLGRVNSNPAPGEDPSLEDNVRTYAAYDERGFLISTSSTKRIILNPETNAFRDDLVTTTYRNNRLGQTVEVISPKVRVFRTPDDTPETASFESTTVEVGYNVFGEVTHRKDERNHIASTTRDVLGRPLHILHPSGATEVFDYDKNGNLRAYTSRRGYTTRYFFDDFNRLELESAPFGATAGRPRLGKGDFEDIGATTYTYDMAGNVLTVSDMIDAVTTYTYNEYDLVESETLVSVARDVDRSTPGVDTPQAEYSSSYTYDDGGNLETSIVNGFATTRTWNPAGELSTIDQEGAVSRFTYNQLGDPLTETDPEDRKTIYCYDGRGNVEVVKLYGPNRGAGDEGVSCSQTEIAGAGRDLQWATATRYDRAGRIKAEIGAEGEQQRTSYAYDDLDRLVLVATPPTDSDRSITEFGYDAAGNLVYQSDGGGRVTRFAYDESNFRTSTIEPAVKVKGEDGQPAVEVVPTWRTEHDAGGLPTKVTNPDGEVVTRQYNRLGLLTTEAAPGVALSFGYDHEGRLQSAKRNGFNRQFFHRDARGAVFLSADEFGDHRTTSTFHPETGLLASRTDPSSETAHEFRWNARNELDLHVDAITGVWNTYTYNDAGQLESEVRNAEAYNRQLSYDDAGRLSKEVVKADNDTKHLAEYTWTANGDINTEKLNVYSRGVGAGMRGRVHDFEYDNARRLRSWTVNELGQVDAEGVVSGGTDIHVEAYDYDKAGNRISLARTTGGSVFDEQWTYDAANRIVEAPDGRYLWNADGTLAEIERNDGTRAEFEFNALGEMLQHDPAGSAGPIDYTYDALGRLATRDGVGFEYSGLSRDPANYGVVGDGAAGFGSVSYSRGPSGRVTSYERTDAGGDLARFDVHLNYRGDVAFERQPRQPDLTSVVQRSPFGEVEYTDSIFAVDDPLRSGLGIQADFTDPATGDVNMGARWYSPGSATFRSRDFYGGELRTPISLNRYTYANNNPARYWDPTGFMAQGCPGCNSAEAVVDRGVLGPGNLEFSAFAGAYNGQPAVAITNLGTTAYIEAVFNAAGQPAMVGDVIGYDSHDGFNAGNWVGVDYALVSTGPHDIQAYVPEQPVAASELSIETIVGVELETTSAGRSGFFGSFIDAGADLVDLGRTVHACGGGNRQRCHDDVRAIGEGAAFVASGGLDAFSEEGWVGLQGYSATVLVPPQCRAGDVGYCFGTGVILGAETALTIATGGGAAGARVSRFSRLASNADVPNPIPAPSSADDLLDLSRAARNARADEVGSGTATVTGGYDPATGQVVAGCSSNPVGCAELDVVRQLDIDPADVRFTEAIRPRTGREVPICHLCQDQFSPSQFPPGVEALPNGPWGPR